MTIQVLGVEDRKITKKEFPLVGFNSNTTYVVRTVALPIMVTSSIVMIKFVRIDVLAH